MLYCMCDFVAFSDVTVQWGVHDVVISVDDVAVSAVALEWDAPLLFMLLCT